MIFAKSIRSVTVIFGINAAAFVISSPKFLQNRQTLEPCDYDYGAICPAALEGVWQCCKDGTWHSCQGAAILQTNCLPGEGCTLGTFLCDLEKECDPEVANPRICVPFNQGGVSGS